MNQNIKNFIEEGEKEFEEKYDCIISDSQSDIYGDRISSFRSQQIQDFIYSRQISLIKMIVEMVEGLNLDYRKDYANWDEVIRTMKASEERGYNQALDTILSKLKESYEPKK